MCLHQIQSIVVILREFALQDGICQLLAKLVQCYTLHPTQFVKMLTQMEHLVVELLIKLKVQPFGKFQIISLFQTQQDLALCLRRKGMKTPCFSQDQTHVNILFS